MEYEYLVRIVIAGVCGALIGYERKSRMKEAGIRTHFIVAVGASLMMVVSKYGFQDQIGWQNLSLDPSRVAAQVVSGIGFLGAGMIFMQRQTVRGLTTAAGIWATAGTGMAIGAGLYIIGLGVTLIILLAQLLLHGKIKRLSTPKIKHLSLSLIDVENATEQIKLLLTEKNFTMLNFQAERPDNVVSQINIEITLKISDSKKTEQLLTLIQEKDFVKSVKVH